MPFLLVAKPRPHVTLVTLNRPERMNAMSFDVMIGVPAGTGGDQPRQRHPRGRAALSAALLMVFGGRLAG
jgi:hypothetical protein